MFLKFLKLLFGGSKTNDELIDKVNNKPFLVDVRNAYEFDNGSVEGAINIPLDKLPSQLSKFKGKDNIIVFCQSGMRSSTAKSVLIKNGITNVINGGSWKEVSQAVEQAKSSW
jgi:phage shock protein E